MAKSSKSHTTDSDVGVRKAESGVGRLRGFASKPSPPLTLSALRPLFRHRNQVGTRHAGKEEVMDIEVRCQIKYCRRWRHNQSALSFDAEKEGAGCGAPVTGWRIGLILRAPCSAAARTLPRKTTCGGFWYFWPQKYKKKKVCGNCDFPEPSQTFSVKFRKTFFSAFRCRKAAKATRPIPMSASGRLKAASGDYSRVCKQTVPAAVAFSPPSAFSPSEPSRGGVAYKKIKKKIGTLYCIILKCVLCLHRESSRTHKILTRKIPLQP